MITIGEAVYITHNEYKLVRSAIERVGWPTKNIENPERFSFKKMSPEVFFEAALDSNRALETVYKWQDDGWESCSSYDDPEWLKELFPKNFASVGEERTFLTPNGSVYSTTLECTGWDSFSTIYHKFNSHVDYLTAVLGPYKEEFLK